MDSIVSVTTECYLTIIYMRQVRVMASDGSATAGSETKVWIRRCQAPDMILNTYTLYPIRQEKIRRYAGQNHKSGILPLYIYRSHNQIIRLVLRSWYYCTVFETEKSGHDNLLTHSNADSSARVKWVASWIHTPLRGHCFILYPYRLIDRSRRALETNE